MALDSHTPGYVKRRPLDSGDLMPAIGTGVVLGLVGFYLAKLFLERAPLIDGEERQRRARVLRGVGDSEGMRGWEGEEIRAEDDPDGDWDDDGDEDLDDVGIAARVREERARRDERIDREQTKESLRREKRDERTGRAGR